MATKPATTIQPAVTAASQPEQSIQVPVRPIKVIPITKMPALTMAMNCCNASKT
ncbi:hypothetical protein [Dechloromonas sp. ZS-1]|uniref:hypothetical protein n=1 Tax=Dechloromonas sp. ZS-1 TaxID=3138067 RepID=UPI0031FD0293